MTRGRGVLLVVAAVVAGGIGSCVAVGRQRAEERRRFAEMLFAMEAEDPAGPQPIHRRYRADLPASLEETLDVMQVAMDGWWLETEKTYELCQDVVTSCGDAGVVACLDALERGDHVLAALECLCGNPAVQRADAARVRRIVAVYPDRAGTVGADASAILRGIRDR